MKAIDGNFPEYVISCNVDHDIIKTLLIAVSWQDDKSVWVLVWDELAAVLDTIGVTFESFQEGCSEAIAMYERGREVIEKRNLMEIVQ